MTKWKKLHLMNQIILAASKPTIPKIRFKDRFSLSYKYIFIFKLCCAILGYSSFCCRCCCCTIIEICRQKQKILNWNAISFIFVCQIELICLHRVAMIIILQKQYNEKYNNNKNYKIWSSSSNPMYTYNIPLPLPN